MHTVRISFIVVTLGLVAVGCSSDNRPGVKTAAVSGTVTVGGKAVEGVEVRFITENFEGVGKTDSAGKYDLVAGAEPGSNKVIFSKIVGGGASKIKIDPDAGMDEGQLQAAAAASGGKGIDVARETIPAEFADRTKTQITFNVPEEGTTSADFKVPAK